MQEFSNMILNQIKFVKNKKIIFWGASLFLKKFLYTTPLKEFHIIGIIDSNPALWGQSIENYEIFSPEKLVDYGEIHVIVTIHNLYNQVYGKIKKEIDNYNLDNPKIYLLPNVYDYRTSKEDSLIHKLSSNKIYLIDSCGNKNPITCLSGLNITWLGENGVIEIGGNPIPKFENCQFILGDNATITLQSSIHTLRNLFCKASAENSKIVIGRNFSVEEAELYSYDTDCSIEIGDDCMFAKNVYIRCDDGHSIYDSKTKEIINKPKNVEIEDHVWLSRNTTILKGSRISENSVVASNSLVNKAFNDKNVIIAGNPATIIKKNINWNRKTTATLEKQLKEL